MINVYIPECKGTKKIMKQPSNMQNYTDNKYFKNLKNMIRFIVCTDLFPPCLV